LDEAEILNVLRLLEDADAPGVTLREVERLRTAALERLTRPPLTAVDTVGLERLTNRLLCTDHCLPNTAGLAS
jgi:hypothetical protein